MKSQFLTGVAPVAVRDMEANGSESKTMERRKTSAPQSPFRHYIAGQNIWIERPVRGLGTALVPATEMLHATKGWRSFPSCKQHVPRPGRPWSERGGKIGRLTVWTSRHAPKAGRKIHAAA